MTARPGADQVTLVQEESSVSGRIRLFEMTFSRIKLGIGLLPVVAIPFAWFYSQTNGSATLLAWVWIYIVLVVILVVMHRSYVRDRITKPDSEVFKKWRDLLQKFALLHGTAMTASVIVTMENKTLEVSLAHYLILALIITTNATHQAPVLGVFFRFFITGWIPSAFLMYWIFSDMWQIFLPISLVFSAVISRHAFIAHRYFVQQIRFEERSVLLAREYKAAKDEAEAALFAKNQFLTTASHDLRQPVHAMGLLIATIHLRNKDASLEPLLDDLRSSVRSVNQMFNSLLDLSKIEAGIVQTQPVPIELRAFVNDTATLFREEANSRNLQLRFRWPKAQVVVLADPALLRQALSNLVHNALRYTQRGGILIGVRRRAQQWQVEVWDTGIGVAEEEQAKIYSPFFRNEHAWRVDTAGHGLGLSVVARCAERMGASYGLSSRLGRGSRFWLRLPAGSSRFIPAAFSELEPVWRAVQPDAKPFHGNCLVLEDDPQASAAWLALLKAWGLNTRAATRASEAFALLDEGFAPQVILCDQRLRSGESGFDILRALLTRCPAAHGAMVSGEFNSPELLEAESEGYLVLRKPLEANDLRAVLSQWLPVSNSPSCSQ